MTRGTDVNKKMSTLNKWDRAIVDAKEQLRFAQGRVEKFQKIVTELTEMRDAGEPWPVLKRAGTANKAAPA